MKYRDVRDTVYAFQMTEEAAQNPETWPKWLREKHAQSQDGGSFCLRPGEKAHVHTEAGRQDVEWGDWIILEITGSIWACDPDRFGRYFVPAD